MFPSFLPMWFSDKITAKMDNAEPRDLSVAASDDGRERYARENHSEIERRRRNKMTHYINELADMVGVFFALILIYVPVVLGPSMCCPQSEARQADHIAFGCRPFAVNKGGRKSNGSWR